MIEFRIIRGLKPVCPTPTTETISGFSRYQRTVDSLPWLERKKVNDLANYIFASFWPGCVPILSVRLVGHADTDLQKGHAFEREISLERAVKVENYLRNSIAALSKNFKAAPAAPVPTDIRWDHDGVGAIQPASQNLGKNPNALSEPERAMNRRVEVILEPIIQSQPSTPWTFDPTDAQKRLQKTVDDSWKRWVPPSQPPPPPPNLPPWFWKNLPKLDDEPAWKKWRKDVKDWCERNHVDPDPIMDTFKDILRLPDGSPGPIDSDFEKELRQRQIVRPPPSDDD
jgi:hypothetical protein